MEFREVIKIAKDVQEKIDEKFGRHSDKMFFFVDLVEEVGELAEVIRAKEFYKKEPKEDLESELADIFYDLVGLAKEFNIDLENAIVKRMRLLKEKFLEE